jgi:predicted permease
VLLAGLRIGMHGYDEARGLTFYRQLREQLVAMPGVREAALASWFPLGFEGGSGTGVEVPGYERQPNEDTSTSYAIVSPGYFATLGIPLVAGRDFTDADDANRPRVAIINETMARRYWPGQDPVGRKFLVWGGQRELTVVGVAKDGKYRFLSEPPKAFVYFAYQQGVWDLNLGVALRTEGDPLAFAGALRERVHALDPGVELWAVQAMTDFVQASFLPQKIVSRLLVALGTVALVLAAMGIYGVMAYVVSQRTHELGIRMALGATAAAVTRLVLSQGMRLTLFGLGLGLLGAVSLSHLLRNFLHGISPFDPLTFLGVSAVLTAVGLAACAVPAWRAARLEPMTALRQE